MKKLFLIFAMIAGINASVFSLTETWLSFGLEYGNFFESASEDGETASSYMSSPGFNMNSYLFYNKKNAGLFIHDFFGFPKKITTEIDGIKTEADLDVYDMIMQIGMIIGPGFRFNFSDRLKLQYGIGFSFMETAAYYSSHIPGYGAVDYSMIAYNLGIGGDIGIKFDITDIFFLNIGSAVTFDFACYTSVQTTFEDESGWAKNYSMMGFRPYICIGINSFRTSNNLGKPK